FYQASSPTLTLNVKHYRSIVLFAIVIRLSSLSSERKVKTHEVAAGPLIQAGIGSMLGQLGGEFLVPSQSRPAVHERVVAIAYCNYISVPKVAGSKPSHRLARDPSQLVSRQEK